MLEVVLAEPLSSDSAPGSKILPGTIGGRYDLQNTQEICPGMNCSDVGFSKSTSSLELRGITMLTFPKSHSDD